MKNRFSSKWIRENDLSNKVFENAEIESMSLGHRIDTEVIISNTKFINSAISKGSFTLGEFTTLRDVEFNNFDPSPEFSIHPGATLNGVTFKSGSPDHMLWIKDVLKEYEYCANPVQLDISEFEGEVIITGVNITNIKINPNKHLIISADLLQQTKFKINRANYFRGNASKASRSGAPYGIFTINDEYLNDPIFREQFDYFLSVGMIKTSL